MVILKIGKQITNEQIKKGLNWNQVTLMMRFKETEWKKPEEKKSGKIGQQRRMVGQNRASISKS